MLILGLYLRALSIYIFCLDCVIIIGRIINIIKGNQSKQNRILRIPFCMKFTYISAISSQDEFTLRTQEIWHPTKRFGTRDSTVWFSEISISTEFKHYHIYDRSNFLFAFGATFSQSSVCIRRLARIVPNWISSVRRRRTRRS